MFDGWSEYTPTNILVKALVQGFGGGVVEGKQELADIPPEAFKIMQDSAVDAIAAKAGNRLPIVKGRDRGLPKAPPIFDLETLRQLDKDALAKRFRKTANEK